MQVCRQCSRVNPPEAAYCYHDGALLAGHRAAANPGARPFVSPFVFPSGLSCRNFDQLATACQQNWQHALDLLQQGFLASFFGGLGRVDLAQAAQEALRLPDADRGLDHVLSKLPTQVLEPPTLKVEPSDVNLGMLPMGTQRALQIQISNVGMRLLYGSVVSDSKWLAFGEGLGSAQKIFQCGAEITIGVRVHGQHLRAGAKQIEGRLIVESNGGTAVVRVRAEVPPIPFAEGVLAGAISPRQIAEKAKARPNDAAPLFESAAVADWFTRNGWTYPVQGPSASGLGAIQQFFEALGLVRAPKLEISAPAISLRGEVGQQLQASIEVSSPERRPVYAHAMCDQPWLDIGRVKLSGRYATIPILVPHVPDRPGETLRGNVHVTGNGQQRFVVPLSLTVEESNPFANLASATPPIPVAEVLTVTQALPTESLPIATSLPIVRPLSAPELPPVAALPPVAVAMPIGPAMQELVPVETVASLAPRATLAAPATVKILPTATVQLSGAETLPAAPLAPGNSTSAASGSATTSIPDLAAPPGTLPWPSAAVPWRHLVPLALLALCLAGIMARDWLSKPPEVVADVPVNRQPRLMVYFDFSADREEVRKKKLAQTMSFGVVAVDPQNPKNPKRLTFHTRGLSNNAVVRIDGNDRVFGRLGGEWYERPADEGKWGKRATYRFYEQILVTQTVDVVAGEPVEVGEGRLERFYDTCQVRYTIRNAGAKSHVVGLRFLLDTYIGGNDAAPYTIPGLPGMIDIGSQDLRPPVPLPDFIQALENPSLQDPGLVAYLNPKIGGQVEPPSRISLTRPPGSEYFQWEVPVVNIRGPRQLPDSAIVMYWDEAELRPGQIREAGFAYGLGNLASKTGRIALTVGGSFAAGGELSVVALVSDPGAKETLTLKLPRGLSLIQGQATQAVPGRLIGAGNQPRPSPVTWRIRADTDGTFSISVESSKGYGQSKILRIKPATVF